jgi:hypothetical protein
MSSVSRRASPLTSQHVRPWEKATIDSSPSKTCSAPIGPTHCLAAPPGNSLARGRGIDMLVGRGGDEVLEDLRGDDFLHGG